MRHHVWTLVLISIAGATQSEAQSTKEDTPGTCAIWGQIVTPGRSSEERADIELAVENHKPSQKTRVINGNFNLPSVPPGWYQFRVLDQAGRMIYKLTKFLKGANDHVIIQLPQPLSTPSVANTISCSELRHKTTRKAQDEFNASEKAADTGNLQKSSEHLLKALQIDPEYPEARANLAALYARMNRIQEALQEAQRVFEMNPGYPEAGSIYAFLLMFTKNYQQCESVARCTIRKQYYTAEMKAALAVSLIGQRRNLDEALVYLGQAVSEYPRARLFAADALVETGQPIMAANQVRTYLKSSANHCERKELEAWVAGLMPPELIAVESH